MCLTPGTDTLALKHLEYVQAAIISARFNAPTLAPYVILVSKSMSLVVLCCLRLLLRDRVIH